MTKTNTDSLDSFDAGRCWPELVSYIETYMPGLDAREFLETVSLAIVEKHTEAEKEYLAASKVDENILFDFYKAYSGFKISYDWEQLDEKRSKPIRNQLLRFRESLVFSTRFLLIQESIGDDFRDDILSPYDMSPEGGNSAQQQAGKVLEKHLRNKEEDLKKIYYPFFETLKYFVDEIDEATKTENWKKHFKSGKKEEISKLNLAIALIKTFEKHSINYSSTLDAALDQIMVYFFHLADCKDAPQETALHLIKKARKQLGI